MTTDRRAFDALTHTVIAAALRAGDPVVALDMHWVDPGPVPVFLGAIGKASIAMARRAGEHLGRRVVGGVVIGPPGLVDRAALPPGVIAFEADHPLPTARNVQAASAMQAELVRFAREHPRGTVVCLLSGGGSAHLTLPAGNLTLEDLRGVNSALQRAGAPIEDLNTVRKHTEALKGGRLAIIASPVRIQTYVLSDVIGDAVDAIASGPTAPDPTTYTAALEVLERHGCLNAAPAVAQHLRERLGVPSDETPKPGDPRLRHVHHTVIASNRAAVDAVCDELARQGLAVAGVRRGEVGEAADIGRRLAKAIGGGGATRPACAVVGGEPTVRVGTESGRGGPSQELALACALEMERLGAGPRAGVVAFSTDGIDGPTDAAGAALGVHDLARARSAGLDPHKALREHDSHGLLGAVGALIRTGPTGTNINHVAVAMAW